MNLGTKTVILDFGNVVAPFSHEKACKGLERFSDFTAKQIQDIVFGSIQWQWHEKGEFSPHQFYEWVIEQISTADTLSFAKFTKIWSDILGENLDIDGILERIRPRIKKLLLSNTDPMHWQRLAELPVIKTHFPDPAQQILSFRLGLRKPDPDIFRRAIQVCGVLPQEIVYVDDVPEYVAAFENLGVRGIVYSCQIDPIEVLESRLLELDVLV